MEKLLMRKNIVLFVVLVGLGYIIGSQVGSEPDTTAASAAAVSTAANTEAKVDPSPEYNAPIEVSSAPIESLTANTSCQHDRDEKKVMLVVGDSLSSAFGIDKSLGWVSLLQSRLDQLAINIQVFNASISGDTTSGGLTRLKKKLSDLQPAVVVIELGGNDGLRALPLDVMERNIRQMITMSQNADAQPVLMGMRIPSNYGPRYTEKFHQIYGELARQHSVPLTPFFMENVALDKNLMQSDGIHPNAQAQTILLNNAWPAIKQALEVVCRN